MTLNQVVVSPCCNPEMELEPVLAAYSKIGYRQFEVFTVWVKSAFDYRKDPAFYRAIGQKYGMSFTSMHLPPITDDIETSLAESLKAAAFAAAIGAKVVLFKAHSRALYIAAAKRFLDGIEGLGITPVLQNHNGTPITTIDDFREVITGINDPRMKTLLEVGHFHLAGVPWRAGYELLKGSIALVHLKDMKGGQSVRFGAGEIDFYELFQVLEAAGYRGNFVVEMEVADKENTLAYLADALNYITAYTKRQ